MTKREPKLSRTRPPARVDAAAVSFRLTADEKAVVDRAALLRGWTPTALVRRAAVERAAQIINADTHTALDLQGFAEQVASVLCAERQYFVVTEENGFPARRELDVVLCDPNATSIESDPPALSFKELDKLVQAAALGGAEFLRLVVERCKFLSRDRSAVQPLDPSKIVQAGRKPGSRSGR